MPYALSNRRDRPPQGQSSKRPSGLGQNLGRPVDAADNRAWFCWAYRGGGGGGAGGVQPARPSPGIRPWQRASDSAAYLRQVLPNWKSSRTLRTGNLVLVPQAGHHDKLRSSPYLCTVVSQRSLSLVTPSLWCRRKKNLVQNMVQANKAVRISGKPNFLGCHIPVPSSLNFEYLEKELADYKDRAIIQLHRYGCPINYEGPGNLLCACHNHRGGTDFPEHIERFLKRVVEAVSVMGPFKSSPFDIPTTVSPLNTVPKRDSANRRVIVDLSFPKCKLLESVNGGISRDCYLGDPIKLRYP